ncbi:MAG: PepSY-associated TM helix domain-containing protein [Novosphingobium sp.]
MNLAIGKPTVRKALSAHAAIGLLAGAFLYLVCLTGTLIVFYEEWQRVEQPSAPEMAAVAPDVVQKAATNVLDAEKGKPRTTHLFVHLPVKALPRLTVTTDSQAFHIDRNGAIAGPEENSWSEFLLSLHYELNLPAIVGMTLVGILGVMIVALSISGVIAHPRIFRDAFRLRARGIGGAGLADWHNRLGVWTLPFALAIALTGAMIGLANIAGFGLATAFYKGDIEAAYAPIFGAEAEPDSTPAGIPDTAAALRHMVSDFPGAEPYYVIIHDPLTAGQHVQVIAHHPRRLIFGESYFFDAAGRFQGKAGLSDGETGQQFAASVYKLHFGNYAGLPVKIVYFLLGLALTVVVATGTSIWLGKRQRRGLDNFRLRNAWHGVVWGIPLVLAATFLARLILGNGAPLITIFWGLAALILGLSVALPAYLRLRPMLIVALTVTSLLSIATPLILHLLRV